MGLIMAASLRNTGIEPVGDMPWGTHFCLFYETKDDLLDSAVPFFKAGLESNEFCLWAVSEPLTLAEAKDALCQAIPSSDRHLIDSSFEILPGREWYLNGNEVDPKKITAGWDEKLRTALARGFDGIRISGNAFWLDTEYWPNFRAYERELDATTADKPMTLLCTYPLGASRANDILEVSRAHQFAVIRRSGEWEIVETAEHPIEKHTLTPREREVLTWVAKGKSAWEISQILHIAKRTVDAHVQTAAHKLGAANRAQAVAIALLHRLIEP
jgi:DNA-binding CsgD family transcriptional regulator